MNKNIKLLLESLFDDDFDELYNDDTQNIVSQQISTAMKITSLSECENKDDVDEYFINKYDLINQVINTIVDVIDEVNRCLNSNSTIFSFDDKKISNENRIVRFNRNMYTDPISKKIEVQFYFECFIGPNKDFKFIIQEEPYSIIYRKKEKSVKAWNIIFNNNKIIWQLSKYPHSIISKPGDKDKNAAINKIIDKINTEQFSNINEKIKKINIALVQKVESLFKTQRITEELTCVGKVYKVTQKDIDRMNKCIDTRNFGGFDKITKSDKMVARLAALFICAKNRNIKDLQLQFNDEILLSIILGHGVYSKSYINYGGPYSHKKDRINMSSKEDYINILRKIQNFPDIHLKDVIATYNVYKDQF